MDDVDDVDDRGHGDRGARAEGVPVHEGLFTVGDEPHLLGGCCDACGRHHFPRATICPYCSSEGAKPVVLSANGRLWAWTAVTAAPPGYRGSVPYGFGVVELREGLRIVTRLTESDPSTLHLGQEMRLVIDRLHVGDDGRDVVTYAFTAVADGDLSRTGVTK